MKSAGKARNNGLYRHIRTSKEIIRNLLNDSYKNTNVGVEELKQQLLQDKDFMQRIKDKVGVEKVPEEIVKEQRDDRLDMDEDMMMAGLSMFENEF